MSQPDPTEIATLGGGCFWCLDAIFRDLRGVLKVESGYAGGSIPNPTYRHVCTGATGHAEVVQITFDPPVISFRELLEVFFVIHDPTTLNRQGADIGTQYRSAVFHHSPELSRLDSGIPTTIFLRQPIEKPLRLPFNVIRIGFHAALLGLGQ